MRGSGPFDADEGFGQSYVSFYDLDLDQTTQFVDFEGERLFVQIFEPPSTVRGSAVVVHGYYDHTGIYGHLIRFLLQCGLRVVAYDQIGHGLSTGPRATIESFDRYVHSLEAVVDQVMPLLDRPRWLVGQSMGGSVAMDFLVRQHGAFDRTLLLAPLVRPAGWASSRIAYYATRPFIKSVPRGRVKNSDNPEFHALLRADPLQHDRVPVQWVTAMVRWRRRFEGYELIEGMRPVVIQGGLDETVDAPYNLSVIRRVFEIDLLEIPDARHHLVNESEEIRRRMWAFLDSHL